MFENSTLAAEMETDLTTTIPALEAAVAIYLTSEYFNGLAPGTQRMRRRLLKNICAEVRRSQYFTERCRRSTELAPGTLAEVRRLCAPEISKARNEIPSETPARSGPWRPVHKRRNWTTA